MFSSVKPGSVATTKKWSGALASTVILHPAGCGPVGRKGTCGGTHGLMTASVSGPPASSCSEPSLLIPERTEEASLSLTQGRADTLPLLALLHPDDAVEGRCCRDEAKAALDPGGCARSSPALLNDCADVLACIRCCLSCCPDTPESTEKCRPRDEVASADCEAAAP